jgi:hypothetical protein
MAKKPSKKKRKKRAVTQTRKMLAQINSKKFLPRLNIRYLAG